ncbi:MAG: hypothetical protein ACYS17_13655 [Planctomycetota bacterium]
MRQDRERTGSTRQPGRIDRHSHSRTSPDGHTFIINQHGRTGPAGPDQAHTHRNIDIRPGTTPQDPPRGQNKYNITSRAIFWLHTETRPILSTIIHLVIWVISKSGFLNWKVGKVGYAHY